MSNLLESKTSYLAQDLTHPRNNEISLLKLQRLGRINQGGSLEKLIKIGETRHSTYSRDQDARRIGYESIISILENSFGKAISSRGASGGIATFCRSDKYNIISAKENTHCILV